MRRHPLVQMLVVGAIASAIGVFVALQIHWFPARASTRAREVDRFYHVLLIVSVPIFVLVVVVVLFSVWKFRMRPGEKFKEGPPIHGNTRLEVVWTAVPAFLIVGLVIGAFVTLEDIESAQPRTMTVDVTARQFAWSFSYPRAHGDPVTSSTLHLPEGRPVEFRVHSADVIHSFWVPAFRAKIDAVPGITTTLRITPSRQGSYPVVCAELCGYGHATMRTTAVVEAPRQFAAWLRGQGRPAPPTAPVGAPSGRQLFTQEGCDACHTLADAGASGTVGPNLDDALKGRSAAFIRQSIVDPNAFVAKGFPPNVMPQTFGRQLSAAQLDALVSYLAKVTR